MSIYSGFATRQQESVYNKLTNKLIYLLSEKIAEFPFQSKKTLPIVFFVRILFLNSVFRQRLRASMV